MKGIIVLMHHVSRIVLLFVFLMETNVSLAASFFSNEEGCDDVEGMMQCDSTIPIHTPLTGHVDNKGKISDSNSIFRISNGMWWRVVRGGVLTKTMVGAVNDQPVTIYKRKKKDDAVVYLFRFEGLPYTLTAIPFVPDQVDEAVIFNFSGLHKNSVFDLNGDKSRPYKVISGGSYGFVQVNQDQDVLVLTKDKVMFLVAPGVLTTPIYFEAL